MYPDSVQRMSSQSKNRPVPLFVNNSQLLKYSCSPNVPSSAISDEGADQWNLFTKCSTVPSKDSAAKQSASVNDIESCHVPYVNNPVSPVFGLQRPLKTLSSDPASLTGGDSTRTVRKSSTFTSFSRVNDSSKSPFPAEVEDNDCSSPILTARPRKRQRHHRRPVLIDSDSSDDSSDCGSKVCKTSSLNQNSETLLNKVAAKSRFPDVERRHCFDLLMNRDSCSTVIYPGSAISLQRATCNDDEPLRRNCLHQDTANNISHSEPLDRKKAGENDGYKKVATPDISCQCSVQLNRLQLCDIPHRIVLSQEDKLSLSGGRSPAGHRETASVSSDSELSTSSDSVHVGDIVVNSSSAVQSSDVPCYNSDDMFSDDELVESVGLSPSHYCSVDEQKIDSTQDITKPSADDPKTAVASKEPEMPFVHYSQNEDDYILIDDSDDDLFANLTQNDVTLKAEDANRHESDDSEEYLTVGDDDDDDEWMRSYIDTADTAAAGAVSRSGVTMSISETCDPWIDDVADVSSDELEEAYNVAMNRARTECEDYVGSDSVAVSHGSDHEADLKLSNHCTSRPCSVLLKPLRVSDVPPEIRVPQQSMHLCEADVDEQCMTGDSFHSDFSVEGVISKSVACKENSITAHGVLCHEDKSLALSAEAYRKPEACELTKSVDSERSSCHEKSAVGGEHASSHVMEKVESRVLGKSKERPSFHNSKEVVKHVDRSRKCSKSAHSRIALEDCFEVAEFYGKTLNVSPAENKWHQDELTVVQDTKNMNTVPDGGKKNSTEPGYLEKDQSCLTMVAPSEKLDHVKESDGTACEEEMWKSKLSVQSSVKSSSVQYQKIAQMRDCSKQKLRKDKSSLSSKIQQHAYSSCDRFQGLSQFSVAKQQLVERNQQLKSIGLYG